MEHAARSRYDTGTFFGMSKVLHLSTYHDRLVGAALKIAFKVPPEWYATCGANPEDVRVHRAAVELCMPNFYPSQRA